MINITITGSTGFVGRHLLNSLKTCPKFNISTVSYNDRSTTLETILQDCDILFHIAGVNRSDNENDFYKGNTNFTETLCSLLQDKPSPTLLVYASSIHATTNSIYGKSKLKAEELIENWVNDTKNPAVIVRLTNIFGKWCKPNYNSVVATFAHNIANKIPIQIYDSNKSISLVYIDEVIEQLKTIAAKNWSGFNLIDGPTPYKITLGELAAKLIKIHQCRDSLDIINLSENFDRQLLATYFSHLSEKNLRHKLKKKSDIRGSLAEFIKSEFSGQIFISTTKPGVIRGNHYHNSKVEKFLVVRGTAIIKLTKLGSQKTIKLVVEGDNFDVIDIPPGFVHSIENIGDGDLITVFWVSEIFNVENPDTYQEI